jgi:hypothetical protein
MQQRREERTAIAQQRHYHIGQLSGSSRSRSLSGSIVFMSLFEARFQGVHASNFQPSALPLTLY